MNYRDRCYKNYVTTRWTYTHSLSEEEYKLFAKVAKKRLRDMLPDNKAAKIIDVACGSGHFLYFLQKEGYTNIEGIDISEEQLTVAKEMKVKNIRMADLFTHLPKYPQSFDMIIACDIIEHMKKDKIMQFLDLIFQSLKQGGKVLITTLNIQSLFVILI